jgi:hypothetical protein
MATKAETQEIMKARKFMSIDAGYALRVLAGVYNAAKPNTRNEIEVEVWLAKMQSRVQYVNGCMLVLS